MRRKSVDDPQKGDKFGRWTVTGGEYPRPMPSGGAKRMFHVRCSCGKESSVDKGALIRGASRGCMECGRSSKVHGLSTRPGYSSWRQMIYRCTRPDNPAYGRYGGAGIKPCERMLTCEGFFETLGDRPDGTTIDRIRNDLGYNCGDCTYCLRKGLERNVRWATRQAQNRNKSSNIKYMGRTIAEWGRITGMNVTTIYARYHDSGMDLEAAIFTPVVHTGRRRVAPDECWTMKRWLAEGGGMP